jgi:hypothetical protein
MYLLLECSNIVPSSNIPIHSYPHFTMNKKVFIAAMLAVATVLAAGLAVLPGSVQKAQANPCDFEIDNSGNVAGITPSGDEHECKFIGPVTIFETPPQR